MAAFTLSLIVIVYYVHCFIKNDAKHYDMIIVLNILLATLIIRLFVRSITQKRMIPKCSHLVLGMILRYPRNYVVLGFHGHRLGLG